MKTYVLDVLENILNEEQANSFWLVHNSHYWIRLASTPLLLSVYYI